MPRSAAREVAEQKRLNEAREAGTPWKKWGPYLSERQWGTVREDYSDNGDAWNYFTHDQSRSRAYKWGEDGMGGICDDKQQLCFALALWNERDPILKERMFGLTNSEANHGEDVKEYYFYVDSTPTHSYMKYLYKYPQREFPYRDLIETNRARTREEFEYELLDTGVFADDRYFDVFVEYAKGGPDDICILITIHNRAAEAARLRVLPTLWFRNTWSWGGDGRKPVLGEAGPGVIQATHHALGEYWLYCDGKAELLFTENESNNQRLWGQPNNTPYVKDAFHARVIGGQHDAVNPDRRGTKAAAHYALEVPGNGSSTIRLRLSATQIERPFADFAKVFKARVADADAFYQQITPATLSADQQLVHRQALAGMLWGKQYYYFDLDRWLREHKHHPLLESRQLNVRNTEWFHMLNADVISMPDKWEYPWYAAWDLAFHTISLALVDFDFAKEQLTLMLRNLYIHPSGQIPAYEWNFSDVNPPVHAFATLWLYKYESQLGRADLRFLERSFQGLVSNFNWWVNRKDPDGRNVFAGGFLGLDNIGIFDRSAPLPTGGTLEQADGTAWMAFYCHNMLEIALILTEYDPIYEEIAFKFVQHFLWITYAMDRVGDNNDEMWDEEDGFFYDLLRLPDGQAMRLKVRSLVGLLPLCVSTVFEGDLATRYPKLTALIHQFQERYPELMAQVAPTDQGFTGYKGRRLLAILSKKKLQRVLGYMLDENEFLGPHGIRSLSRHHLDNPFVFNVGSLEYKVQYLPAESNTGMFGGNSNWRGPVWMPVNTLIIRALINLYQFYGDDFTVECPTGSGQHMTLFQVAEELVRRLTGTFLRNEQGQRPVYGGADTFQNDPHWRDLILFYEYFHGDNGAGLGASHQTGWTALVAPLLNLFGRLDADTALTADRGDMLGKVIKGQAGL
ncbi:hypothetical protein IGB42_01847 [Andreprevotia sp. IGB-42]|uniref:MGH1-like glycoside hydrolase domain-containing protein n=1 Tax=Andreprevotia sp. IGB-42 TaxID=2497473 RepID=UPI00135C0E5C|nr:glucosidase [Andreprevotia sp. IGB-42]KAF0813496.1 hypothetical protein IGB42_01847 [Andreprevotia sp. IGB-42]